MFLLLRSHLQDEYRSRKEYLCYSAIRLEEIWSYEEFKILSGV